MAGVLDDLIIESSDVLNDPLDSEGTSAPLELVIFPFHLLSPNLGLWMVRAGHIMMCERRSVSGVAATGRPA